jgi:DNA-binding PadR family transcriptional regulator
MCIGHAMLALLTEGPQYGLRLREKSEDRTWPLNADRIHTTLRRLERDGLAGSDGSAAPSAGLTRGRRRVPDA